MLTDLQHQLVKEASSSPLMHQHPRGARPQPRTRQDSGMQAASGRGVEEPPAGGAVGSQDPRLGTPGPHSGTIGWPGGQLFVISRWPFSYSRRKAVCVSWGRGNGVSTPNGVV